MCRIVWLGLICCISVGAQTPPADNLAPLLRDFRIALENDRLSVAAELADRLENSVRAKYDAWLIRDARERTQEIIGWLPIDMESLWINQKPFVIDPQQSIELLHGHPTQAYSMDRLMALNGGDIYRALANRTVRLAGGAARRIGEPSMGIPGPVAANVAYFYFFDNPVSLPPPTEQIEGYPAWRATATVDAGAPFRPGLARETREDVNWLVLVKPDVLILANSREMTGQILARMAGIGKGRIQGDSGSGQAVEIDVVPGFQAAQDGAELVRREVLQRIHPDPLPGPGAHHHDRRPGALIEHLQIFPTTREVISE